jgi:hypothetical protein
MHTQHIRVHAPPKRAAHAIDTHAHAHARARCKHTCCLCKHLVHALLVAARLGGVLCCLALGGLGVCGGQ